MNSWMKQNLLSVVVAVGLAASVFVQQSTMTDLRVEVAEMRGDRDKIDRIESQIGDINEAFRNLGVSNTDQLKVLMNNEITAYVNKNRQQKKEARVKEFELAPEKAEGNVYGSPDAKIALIEYSDYDCPFCLRFHPTPKKIVDNSQGNVQWIYKHFPLDSIHPTARKQSVAAECVAKLGGNKAFWAYSQKLMETKNAISQVAPYAEELGVSSQQLSDCMNDPTMAALVQTHYQEGVELGVNGTPATVIYNKETNKAILVSGAVSEAEILKQMQRVL